LFSRLFWLALAKFIVVFKAFLAASGEIHSTTSPQWLAVLDLGKAREIED
jgi:hypothetical protein